VEELFKGKFELKEILKFLVGGGCAVFIDAAVYAALGARIGLSAAKAVSYTAGAAAGFVVNKLWTFGSRQFRVSEIVRYIMLYACSACANTLANRLVLTVIPEPVFAFLCATGVSTVMNFLGQKFVVFKK